MTGLMFHYASGAGHPVVQGSWSADEFRAYIQQHRNHLLNAKDYLGEHIAGTLKPNDRVITFDDGLRCQYDVFLPVLNEFALTAFWFVPTAPLIGVASRLEQYRWARTVGYGSVDKFYDAWLARVFAEKTFAPAMVWRGYLADRAYLSDRDRAYRFWRDEAAAPGEYERVMDGMCGVPSLSLNLTPYHVRTLAQAGHVIGTHSHSHPTKLSALTKEAQEIEYATSTFIVEQVTGTRPVAMSHPNNQWTQHGLEYLASLGYVLGFGATPQGVRHANSPLTPVGRLQIARLNSADIRPSTLVHGRYHDARMAEDHA